MAATVAPITDLVRQVLGNRGELHGLVAEGGDSHTYEPTPEDARVLAAADLLIANGLFLQEPVLRLAEANVPEGGVMVTLADETISSEEWVFDFSFPEQQGVPNPHLWLNVAYGMELNVAYGMEYVEQIRDALVDVDPDGAHTYRANAGNYGAPPGGASFLRSFSIKGVNRVLVALVMVAAVPPLTFASANMVLQGAVPDDRAAASHYGFMTAFAVTVIGVGLLASLRPVGWRLTAWFAGLLPALLGLSSLVYPDATSSLGPVWALAAMTWGAAFVAAAELTRDTADSKLPRGRGFLSHSAQG